MKISLPYVRSRRYLTGVDWVVGMLDHQSRATCGLGNSSQVVVELDGPLYAQTIEGPLRAFLNAHPVLFGRPRRDLTLAPYWEPGQSKRAPPVPIDEVQLPDDVAPADLLRTLARGVNRNFGGRFPNLAFRILCVGSSRSYLAMAFSHWLFDARGAELFLSHLLAHLAGGPLTPLPLLPEPAHLDRWMEMFQAGQRVNRHLLWLREGETASLTLPPAFPATEARFIHLLFDEDKTRQIVARAYREAGYLMLHPFLLAAALQAFHPLLTAHAPHATDFVVPVSTDIRPPDTAASLVFFNQLSFLFYRVPCAAARDRAALAVTLSHQMYQQVKAGLPQDVALASHLMRILPLRALSRVARIPLRGKMASLGFTLLGDSQVREPRSWAGRLRNVIHLPRIPVLPAIGCVASQYAGRLNLVVSADATMVSPAELDQIRGVLERLPEPS